MEGYAEIANQSSRKIILGTATLKSKFSDSGIIK